MQLSRIPSGFRYYVGEAARKRRAVEDCAISVFAGWSYEEVVTPMVDYFALFEQGMGDEAQSSFRFVDGDGRLLALRPDVTSSLARACRTLLSEKPRPLRLCYAAPVFHQQPRSKAEWKRETTQLGCELIGASGIAADLEPLTILAETLTRLGLSERHCVTLNNVEIFNGIAEHLALDENSRERMRSLLDNRDTSGLSALLERAGLNAAERNRFIQVTRLSGKRQIIDEARIVITNPRSRAALESLAETWEAIETLGLTGSFDIDLGDVSGLDYYTGLLLKVYVRGSGIRVGRGGRYDGLSEKFGSRETAIGFVLDLDELTNVATQSPTTPDETAPPASALVVHEVTAAFQDAMKRRRRDECVRMSW